MWLLLADSQGAACRFRHSMEALKTKQVCPQWETKNCFNASCPLRHFKDEKDRASTQCIFELQPLGCRKSFCPFLHTKDRQPPQESSGSSVAPIVAPVSAPTQPAFPSMPRPQDMRMMAPPGLSMPPGMGMDQMHMQHMQHMQQHLRAPFMGMPGLPMHMHIMGGMGAMGPRPQPIMPQASAAFSQMMPPRSAAPPSNVGIFGAFPGAPAPGSFFAAAQGPATSAAPATTTATAAATAAAPITAPLLRTPSEETSETATGPCMCPFFLGL
jgi:hypothetical protein